MRLIKNNLLIILTIVIAFLAIGALYFVVSGPSRDFSDETSYQSDKFSTVVSQKDDAVRAEFQSGGSQITFASNFALGENVSIDYEIKKEGQQQGLKETIILKDKNAPHEFIFDLELKDVKDFVSRPDRSWRFYNHSNKEVFYIPAGFMIDAKGVRSEAVNISIAGDGKAYILKVIADRVWLADPSRAWPVKVDPSVKIDDAGDPGAMLGAGRQVVRTSTGTLYTVINDGGSCEVWKSTDGTSWTEQDSVDNPACHTLTRIIDVAIDSTNKLHLIYTDDADITLIKYIPFTTSDDQFGTEETAITVFTDARPGGIAVDSSDKPHMLGFDAGDNSVYYTNRVSGSWKATVTIETLSLHIGFSIAISEDNIPEISYVNTTDADLTAAVGNVNDAASFTLQDVDISVNVTTAQGGSSIAVDSSGNTWIAYVDATGTNQITLVKHNDADAWSTWQTPVTNSNVGNEPSIVINGSEVYVFYEDELDDIKYDRYTNSWLGETNLQTGTFQDVKAKWSYYHNNKGTTQIDYLFSDATDIYWDKLTLTSSPNKIDDAGDPGAMPGASRQVVRTSSGTLYTVINDGGSCEVWKSSDGTSWTEQDTLDNPACNTTTRDIAVAIDSTGTLHIVYLDDVGALIIRYITFTTSNDQFGTEEVAIPETAGALVGLDITVDSNDKPHMVESDTSNTGVFYTNRISGSWKARSTVEAAGVYRGLSISINEDNIPELSCIFITLGELTAAVGDANDAALFTLQDVDTSINTTIDQLGTSIAVDSSGNTWIAYVDATGTNQITLVKHNDADAWTTWQTPVTNSNAGNEPSIAINGTDVYVFYEDSADDDIKYDKYTGSWLGETTLQTGIYQDTKAKWSFNFNNQGSTQIDYLFSDGTDVYWDKLTIAASESVVSAKIRGGVKFQGGAKLQ